MNSPQKLYGLILAGGYSRRMGQDKSLLNYHGKPQIEYVGDLLQQNCEKVFLSKRADQTTHKAFPSINDDISLTGGGPLIGILSAMKFHPHVSWLVMACDLPFVTQETIQTLIQQRDTAKIATAFISTQDELPEPLCAIWEGNAYSKILVFFKEGIRCPRKILIKSDTKFLQQSNPRWLNNVNDIGEFQEALDILKGEPK